MTTFVNENQRDKTRCKPPAPKQGIGPNGEDHGAAGLEDHRQKLHHRQNEKLQLPEKIEEQHDHPADRTEVLLELVAKGRRRLGRRWLMEWQGFLKTVHARSFRHQRYGQPQPSSSSPLVMTSGPREAASVGLYNIVLNSLPGSTD